MEIKSDTFLYWLGFTILSVVVNIGLVYYIFYDHKPEPIYGESTYTIVKDKPVYLLGKLPKEIQDIADKYNATIDKIIYIEAESTYYGKPQVITQNVSGQCVDNKCPPTSLTFSDFHIKGYADAATGYVDYTLNQKFRENIYTTKHSRFPYMPAEYTIAEIYELDDKGNKLPIKITDMQVQKNVDLLLFNPTLMGGVSFPNSANIYVNIFDVTLAWPEFVAKVLQPESISLLGIGASKGFIKDFNDKGVYLAITPIGFNLINFTSLLHDTYISPTINTDLKSVYIGGTVSTKF
ncbi:MAG: hypothetical protein WC783_00390 [Candidatus Paceibacterota bacterium]|jgi:hypothetical protein